MKDTLQQIKKLFECLSESEKKEALHEITNNHTVIKEEKKI